MTEEAKRCVDALRICHSNEGCIDCRYVERDRDGMSCVNVLFVDAADLIESLSAELGQAQNKLSELLSYVTGGRFSKTDYSTDDMRRFVDDYNQSVCSECDELKEVKRERDAAIENLRTFTEPCRACVHGWIERYITRTNWQWRGVKEEKDE